MPTLKGQIRISYCNVSRGEDYIQVVVRDELSGQTFLEAKVSLQDFAMMTMGSRMVPCELELEHPERAGMVRETKLLSIPLPECGAFRHMDGAALAKALAPFEVDGWQAFDPQRMNNPRCHTVAKSDDDETGVRAGQRIVVMTYERFVPSSEGETA